MPPERWLELTVHSELEWDVLAPVLLEFGGSAVQDLDGSLKTHVAPPENLDAFLASLQSRLEALAPQASVKLEWRWQDHEDWVHLWRRGLGLRKITSRLFVAPSWEELQPGAGEMLVVLDPGMAFGTAEHATTRSCLRALDVWVAPGSRIADVGAGSGILSIAAALLGAREVVALESDGPSCEAAEANLVRNGVSDRVSILHATVTSHEALPGAPFHGVVANLQTLLLVRLLPALRASLGPGGWLVGSGILLGEREEVQAAAEDAGMTLSSEEEEEGWWTGVFTLSSALSGESSP